MKTRYYCVAEHGFCVTAGENDLGLMTNYEPFATSSQDPVFVLTDAESAAPEYTEESRQEQEGQVIVCGKSGDGWTHVLGEGNVKLPEATLIGYCETQNSGFMEIYECPFCFKKFRYHGATTDRWNEDRFLLNMFARWKVQQHKKEHKS